MTEVLHSLLWTESAVIDLGPLSVTRHTEAFILLWFRVRDAFANAAFNKIVHD